MAAAPKKDKAKKNKDEPTVELVSESKKNDIYLLKEPVSSHQHTATLLSDSIALNVGLQLGCKHCNPIIIMYESIAVLHTSKKLHDAIV
jgi:hypothetical protein